MKHITINSDRSVTVPVELRKIGVQYDHNVNTIEFVGPRYSGNVDLSTMTIYINYILSDKTPGKYKAENVIIDDQDDSLIRFNWTITRNVTKVSGILSCLICAKKTDEEGNEINHWNTDIFRLLSVSEGMENDLVIQEQYPDVITSIMQNIEEHNAKLLEFSGLNIRVTDLENNVDELKGDIGQLSEEIADCIKSPASAEVGQIVKISAVDDAGKPTAWEAVDLSEQVQPDWNQNDDTATDFVKNRPFYSETRNITVENAVNETLKGFPVFSVGDTVTVNVDGVEYSLVAYDDEGCVTIGDTFSSFENGEGQLGWKIYFIPGHNERNFYATESHTVSYLGIVVHKVDDKFVNFGGFVRTFDYHFKNYFLYKTLYNDAGYKCILYTCSDIILPESESILFGFMSGAGLSEVRSSLIHSCFVTGYEINDIGNINIRKVVLGTDTAEMVQIAEGYGYTHTTNPKA